MLCSPYSFLPSDSLDSELLYISLWLFYHDRWWHEQKCQPSSDGKTKPSDGQNDGSSSPATNGYVYAIIYSTEMSNRHKNHWSSFTLAPRLAPSYWEAPFHDQAMSSIANELDNKVRREVVRTCVYVHMLFIMWYVAV